MLVADTPDVAAIRRFNRFHTRHFGVMGANMLGLGVTLAEARVLYELSRRDGLQASELARMLGLDPAYLSRILRRFVASGWLERERAEEDGRARRLTLTAEGRAAFAPLEAASQAQAQGMLERLDQSERADLVAALSTAQVLLGGPGEQPASVIRTHRPGDLGWIVSAHARAYAQDYGWDESFEALVAEIARDFLRGYRPERERCFIAELGGSPVGSACVVDAGDGVAKLRLVLVEKRARGLGLGKRLVAEAIAFARQAGYRRMTLWTNDILHSARAIYVSAGFALVASEPYHAFGHDLVSETWELDLAAAPVT